MRKTALLLVLLLLLPVFLCPASAELYLDQEPPAEWADRTDILRLTTFPTLINDCFLLEVGGKSMLIDGGVQKWGFKLSDALNELGFQHVDVIFNTHPHNDHLECVTWLLKKRLTADEFWSGLPETFRDDMQQEAVKQLQKSGIPYHQLSQYETVDFGGATLVFYWWEDAFDLNARSVQLHITFGERTMLLSADIGGEAQQNLLKQVPPELLLLRRKKQDYGQTADTLYRPNSRSKGISAARAASNTRRRYLGRLLVCRAPSTTIRAKMGTAQVSAAWSTRATEAMVI